MNYHLSAIHIFNYIIIPKHFIKYEDYKLLDINH